MGKHGSYHSIKLKTFSFKKCHICYYTFSKHKFDICKANPHISTQSGVLTHRLHFIKSVRLIALFSSSNGQCQGKYGSYHSIKLKTFSCKKCHICYYTFSKHKFDICKANPHISTQSGVLTHRLHLQYL